MASWKNSYGQTVTETEHGLTVTNTDGSRALKPAVRKQADERAVQMYLSTDGTEVIGVPVAVSAHDRRREYANPVRNATVAELRETVRQLQSQLDGLAPSTPWVQRVRLEQDLKQAQGALEAAEVDRAVARRSQQ